MCLVYKPIFIFTLTYVKKCTYIYILYIHLYTHVIEALFLTEGSHCAEGGFHMFPQVNSNLALCPSSE